MTSLPLYQCHPVLYLKDLLRYDFTSCLAAFLLNLSGCTGQTAVRIKNKFVRHGLKIISGDFEEDLTKIVGGVAFQRFLRKAEIAENLYNRKLAPLNIEFVLIQGIQWYLWYLIFENRSNGSKVTVLTKVQL